MKTPAKLIIMASLCVIEMLQIKVYVKVSRDIFF